MLAAAKDWDNLLALASENRLPVGVEALIGVSKEYSAPEAVTAKWAICDLVKPGISGRTIFVLNDSAAGSLQIWPTSPRSSRDSGTCQGLGRALDNTGTCR